MKDMEATVARKAMFIYMAISLVFSLLFLVGTYLTGKDYSGVARAGGFIWVFILAMIITMPVIIPKVKKRYMG